MNAKIINSIEPFIIGPAKIEGNFTYSEPLMFDFAKEVYDAVLQKAATNFPGVNAFNRTLSDRVFEFNKNTGEINGTSTFFGVLANQVLEARGLRTPTLTDIKPLYQAGRFKNGVDRDFGAVLYSSSKESMGEGDLRFPLVLPFDTLDLREADNEYGVRLVLTNKVIKFLPETDYPTALFLHLNDCLESGTLKFYRCFGGVWHVNLASSSKNGRIDRVCGEASEKLLRHRLAKGIDMLYESNVTKLEKQRVELESERTEAFRQIDSYFR